MALGHGLHGSATNESQFQTVDVLRRATFDGAATKERSIMPGSREILGSKLRKAQELGIRTVDELEFTALLGKRHA